MIAAPSVRSGSRAAPVNCHPNGGDSAGGVDRSAVPSRGGRPAGAEAEAAGGAEAPKEGNPPNPAAGADAAALFRSDDPLRFDIPPSLLPRYGPHPVRVGIAAALASAAASEILNSEPVASSSSS